MAVKAFPPNSAQVLSICSNRQGSSWEAQARHFCCLPQQLRWTATKSQAASLQARPGQELQNGHLGKTPWSAGRRRRAPLPATTTSQQWLLIELPAGGEILCWCLSYQPHNTPRLFKTSSRGTLPEEQRTKGQVQLDGWEESRNLESKSRSGVLQWEALSLQTAPCLPQPDSLCGQEYHYTLTSTSRF